MQHEETNLAPISRRQFLIGAASVGALAALALSGCSSSGSASSTSASTTGASTQFPVDVTDLMGRTVTIQKADAVVTLCATGFDRMLVLGQTNRIVGNFGTLTDWAQYCNNNTAVKSLGGGNIAGNPDVETLNALGTNVLFCWQEAIGAGNVTDPNKADFQALCAQLSTGNPTSVASFREYLATEIRMYASALAQKDISARAEEWITYVQGKFDYILAKTSKLTNDQLVKVYCARGGKSGSDPLNAFLKYSYPDFCIQIAGGVNVTDAASGESYGDVTAEQIATWNPQYVFCGRISDKSAITGSAAFTGTDALKNGKVSLTPSGVMEWDTGSECVLNALYMAKMLHPDLFSDLDMKAEIKTYYATFFTTQITDAQAQNILNRMGPNA